MDRGISKINILIAIKIIIVIFKSDFCIEIQNFSKPSGLNSLLYYSWQIWDSPDWNSYIPTIFYTEYLMRKVGWLCLFLTSEKNSQIHFSSHNFFVQRRLGPLDFIWGFPHLCISSQKEDVEHFNVDAKSSKGHYQRHQFTLYWHISLVYDSIQTGK